GKGVVTGNPVRREFFEIAKKERDPARFSVLVFGGSQGARAINEGMLSALPHLEAHKGALKVVHQTGEADFEKVRAGYDAAGWGESAEVLKYIDDMVARFAESDLVVCRAGATTTAELIAAGKASLMVPFPFAADDHQRKNAEALERAGASRMVLQQDATGERIAREIVELAGDPGRVTRMEEAARSLARGDAASAAVDLMERIVSSF
ncbi:MAG TPA: glycosyltransferase, partial [Pyrinomonadaceae bacterium]|nr:glycosyltransferase [Pyrinomonadaceae bacterium]